MLRAVCQIVCTSQNALCIIYDLHNLCDTAILREIPLRSSRLCGWILIPQQLLVYLECRKDNSPV
jgi:hypothetical protein